MENLQETLTDNPSSTEENLLMFIREVSSLMIERNAINKEIRDKLQTAKRFGFDPKFIREAIRQKHEPKTLIEENRQLVDLYTEIARKG